MPTADVFDLCSHVGSGVEIGLDVSMDFVNLPTFALCHVVPQAPLVFRTPLVALVPVVERPCLRCGSMSGGADEFLKACVCGLIEVGVQERPQLVAADESSCMAVEARTTSSCVPVPQ